MSTPSTPVCTQPSGCQSSTVLPTRRWSRVWPPRPRRPAGTGVFLWDHLRWRAPVRQVADPWITLAAVATATKHLRLGPMITPLARRRPAKVARETATLDRLSGGRLTLGVGLGSDRFGSELSKTGEQLDDRLRGQMLDEALEILTAAWSGAPVHHRGRHYTIEGIQFLPRPVQQPGVPVWVAGFTGNVKPLRRAARHDGFFPANLEHPDQLADIVATTDLRQHTTAPYDFAVELPPGTERPTPRQAPPGGWSSSPGTRCRWIVYAACSATARRHPEPSSTQRLMAAARASRHRCVAFKDCSHS
jgi:Luciferase-like monooxygenase